MEQVTDEGASHKYFWQTPNIIDDLDLDPYAFRLYCHYKRKAGERGTYKAGMRQIGKLCKMSAMTVSNARQDLVTRGLITVTSGSKAQGIPDTVKIVDIWPDNMARYATKPVSPDLQVGPKPVNVTIQVSPKPVSPDLHIQNNSYLKEQEREEQQQSLSQPSRNGNHTNHAPTVNGALPEWAKYFCLRVCNRYDKVNQCTVDPPASEWPKYVSAALLVANYGEAYADVNKFIGYWKGKYWNERYEGFPNFESIQKEWAGYVNSMGAQA